ncbi:MAG TPA: PilN domain-containing protein [Halomonas sp.]|nr:PilN domain-containing protein [Halomonas sp.]
MTVEINLLPWREERRARRSRRFHVILVVAALLGLGGGYGMTWHYQQEVEAQRQRNAYVKAQSRQLDSVIREISELEQIHAEMLEQVQLFTELQSGRTQTVHIMNDLAMSLVDGVYYTRLERQGDALRLRGRAENNRQVSDQLRALALAASFNEPMLSEVEAEDGSGQRRFSLSMRQQVPDVEAGDKGTGAGDEVEKGGGA